MYLDDVLIFTQGTLEDHLKDMDEVLLRLKEHGLIANPSKCELAKRVITYVGNVVSRKNCRPDPSLTKAIENYPRPKILKDLRELIGLRELYRAYIENYTQIAAPLSDLTKKERPFLWTEDQKRALEMLKERLVTRPVLAFPDFERRFRVNPDWSKQGRGAVLAQLDENSQESPIAYLSRHSQGKESLYSSRRGEATALWWSVKRWRPFLEGREFMIICDNRRSTRKPADRARVSRWGKLVCLDGDGILMFRD